MTYPRHAYLIIAYNQPHILQRLIEAIDDERNDIFVHVDKKASYNGRSFHASYSSLHTYHSIDARWGDYSLVEVELLLIGEALKHGSYSYLHLLSDSDYPIKTQDFIHAECQRLAGHEFIGFSEAASNEVETKVQRYHLFPRDFRNKYLPQRILRKCWLIFQSFIGYRRNATIAFRKGPQWWSITTEFAKYIYQHRKEIHKTYHHTYCPDEVFVQTLCVNSTFKDSVDNFKQEFAGCRRFIKWNNNTIASVTNHDIPSMISSPCWFVRKIAEGQTELISSIDKILYPQI